MSMSTIAGKYHINVLSLSLECTDTQTEHYRAFTLFFGADISRRPCWQSRKQTVGRPLHYVWRVFFFYVILRKIINHQTSIVCLILYYEFHRFSWKQIASHPPTFIPFLGISYTYSFHSRVKKLNYFISLDFICSYYTWMLERRPDSQYPFLKG